MSNEGVTNNNNENSYLLQGLVIIVFILLGVLVVTKILTPQEKTPPTDNTLTIESTPEASSTSNSAPIVDNKQMKSYTSAPKMQLETGKKYTAVFKTTDGDLNIDLFADKTPITVNNFVFLAKEGFYNNVRFHRIIKDFMVQTGDPEGTGRGGPGYRFNDEPFTGEYTRGTVAMANAGADTNGSQFFIMTKDVPIQKAYVIFGKLADEASFATLDKIANTPVYSTGEGSAPKEEVLINSVEVTAN